MNEQLLQELIESDRKLMGQIRILVNEIRAVVEILTEEQRNAWFEKFRELCEKGEINFVTGLKEESVTN